MAIKPILLTVKCPTVKSFSFKAKFLLNNQENYRLWPLENLSESKPCMCTVCMSLAFSSLPKNTFSIQNTMALLNTHRDLDSYAS